jgi:ubiquinone/menaquinone biosynthesis C-methylase UbiE
MLDFVCGTVTMTGHAAQAFSRATITGVDPSGDSIARAQQRYPQINFALSGTTIPAENLKFDLACAAGVFHHIPFDEHTWYADEVMRTVKRGGSFVVFELNPLNPLTVRTFKRSPIDRNARMLTPWYARKLFAPYGRVTTKFYCFFPNPLRLLRPLEPALSKLPLGALYATLVTKR